MLNKTRSKLRSQGVNVTLATGTKFNPTPERLERQLRVIRALKISAARMKEFKDKHD